MAGHNSARSGLLFRDDVSKSGGTFRNRSFVKRRIDCIAGAGAIFSFILPSARSGGDLD